MRIFPALRVRRFAVCSLLIVAVLGLRPAPAYALRDRTIVLRAAGSGAVLGLGIGLVTSVVSKGSNAAVYGLVAGAIAGTIYGFVLVKKREQLNAGMTYASADGPLDLIEIRNAERDAILARSRPPRVEFALPIPVYRF
ncbi:MAG: hypothetical protein JST04_09745 [Bdellovibrionales bacterium]|nr:hypothetical protein [Bdellovibrionales bacterium]